MVRRCALPAILAAVVGFSLVAVAPAQAERRSLSGIVEIAEAGAPGLALTMLNEHQPSAAGAPVAWERWERTRIEILIAEGAWERALARLGDPPAAASPEFRRWALERSAEMHLRRDDAPQALTALRRLLWDGDTDFEGQDYRYWRQLVVRAYLADERTDDAVTAMRRFDVDHPGAGDDWIGLRARVLLRAGRAEEALEALPDDPAPGETAALHGLARLASGAAPPEEIITEVEAALGDDDLDRADRARLYALMRRAASASATVQRYAMATERAFHAGPALPGDDRLFLVEADDVWRAWLAWGRQLGNEEQLLVGEDGVWFAAADGVLPEYPARARALLSVVALQGGEDAGVAHEHLVELLLEGPGAGMTRRLYMESGRFPEVTAIPDRVRYRLVDEALARDDVRFARELVRDLDAAPDDRDPFDWRLLRARVLVLGGDPAGGADALDALVDDAIPLSPDDLDRILQVLFDLQGAREHERARALLERLGEQEVEGQRRRELLYWRAESEQALGQHRRAAELYMRSATLLDGRGGDRWGQTARYHAAGQLAEMGLVNDARRIYRTLLAATDDPGRRSQLRNRLQQLELQDAGPEDLPFERGLEAD